MNNGECVIHDLADHLARDPDLKAVWLDANQKKVSFAFQHGIDVQMAEKRLKRTVGKHQPAFIPECPPDSWNVLCELCERGTGEPLPEGIELLPMPGAGIMLQKVSCETASRLWKWDQFKWVRLRPRQLPPQGEVEDPQGWKYSMAAAVLCGVSTGIGFGLERGASQVPFMYPLAAYVVAYLAGAFYPGRDVWELVKKRVLDIHFLMLCVAAGAAFIGHWWEGAILLFLFSFSGALEELAMARTQREIKGLYREAPKEATRVNDQGQEEALSVDALVPGMLLRIRPGEQFPVDAQVTRGASAADESNLTGEAAPVDKAVGDTVLSGTMNLWGAVDCRVLRPASESSLAKIIRLIREAQDSKAPSQRFTDKFGSRYTYAILGLSFAMFFVWWLGMGVPAFLSAGGQASAFYRTMTLLVVASPCALVLSIPSAILAGIASGARQGVLFRGGAAIEQLAEISLVALDKTGTLTTGDLRVVRAESFPPGREEEVFEIAASLGHHSPHPISRAIAGDYKAKGLTILEVSDFRSLTGQGLAGTISRRVEPAEIAATIGRRTVFEETNWIDQLPLPEAGYTEVLVECGEVRGRILLKDEVRQASAPLLRELREQGIQVAMLTGDRPESARLIADELGLSEVHPELHPDQKVERIKAWTRQGHKVAMVGDGVNDAPSLAAAHVAIGMGLRGSDSVLEQADVVLIQDRLENFNIALDLSRRARRIIKQNLAVSLGVIVVLVVGALGSLIPLTLGVLGHEGSTVVVVVNSMRLLFHRRNGSMLKKPTDRMGPHE